MESGRPFFLCAAPKTGCTSWANFGAYLHTGKVIDKELLERRPGLVHSIDLLKDLRTRLADPKSRPVQMFDKHERVLIARNPYIRFVSSYLDWLFRHRLSPKDVSMKRFFVMYKARNLTEAGYLKTAYSHIDPISLACNMQNVGYTFILRVEQQNLWFEWMLQRYGMAKELKKWMLSGNVLYNPGTNGSSKVADHLGAVLGHRAWPSEKHHDSHNRNSEGRLMEFYTPELARGVFLLFEADFVYLGYPAWDGTPSRFRLV
jgi:hypothetical protein